ncbi:unnamed protein product [Sphagnum jensenii]|uniref:Uncharacterized protein n=2 Tax=Sphagnum jensenii TaxID=128206 RepID=A0ABP0VF01_9BRYO
MADSWVNYLYKSHDAVAVSLLMSETSLNLLDVLVKSTTRGKLQVAGSMVGLGTPESADTVALLQKKLQDFKSGARSEDDGTLEFTRSGLANKSYTHTVTSRASVKSSVDIFHNGVGLDLGGEKHLECNLKEVRFATAERVYEIWVIYEILYSRDIDVALVDSKSGSGSARSSINPIAADVEASVTRQNIIQFKATKDNMKPFGFKAIHAKYDANGKFQKLDLHAGGKPIQAVRSDESDLIHPRTDLKGLFLKPPGDKKDDVEEDLLECLQIERYFSHLTSQAGF